MIDAVLSNRISIVATLMHDKDSWHFVYGDAFFGKEIPLFGSVGSSDLNLLAFATDIDFRVKLLL